MLSVQLLFALLSTAVPEDSVVRIQNYSARYDYQAPSKILPPESGLGSGFVIGPGRILTNAHVVRDSLQVVVKKHHVAESFVAKVEVSGNDCDLAVLTVDDPAFMKGTKALELAELPKARSMVVTYGYPSGGQEVSVDQGHRLPRGDEALCPLRRGRAHRGSDRRGDQGVLGVKMGSEQRAAACAFVFVNRLLGDP